MAFLCRALRDPAVRLRSVFPSPADIASQKQLLVEFCEKKPNVSEMGESSRERSGSLSSAPQVETLLKAVALLFEIHSSFALQSGLSP